VIGKGLVKTSMLNKGVLLARCGPSSPSRPLKPDSGNPRGIKDSRKQSGSRTEHMRQGGGACPLAEQQHVKLQEDVYGDTL
jgi:hypothetical protein